MRLVSLFALEYGWTKRDVMELTNQEIEILANLIKKRHKQQQDTLKNKKTRRK